MTDPRVDEYIGRSPDFAKPILIHIRQLVHQACPEVEETMKWSFPNFVHHGILCNMAAFKAHCSLGFWKAALLFGTEGPAAKKEDAMGHFGRITSLADLPADGVLIGLIQKAAELNKSGAKVPRAKPPAKAQALETPDYFMAALRKNKKALAAFESYPPSHKKEYVQWVTEAKKEETRLRRLAQAVARMEEGKTRNWEYEKR